MIGETCCHRWRARLPHLCRPTAVDRCRHLQRLAQARVWQDEVVIDVKHRQLMLHAVLTLTQRVDPPADRGHALANIQIESVTVDRRIAPHIAYPDRSVLL